MRFHIQEFGIDFQSDDEAVPYFIITDGQIIRSSAVSAFRKFGEKFCYYN